jgi:peroxiredoxin
MGFYPDAAPKLLAIHVGQTMPAKTLADLDGITRRLGGPGRKPVLLSFFFAECAPCIQEIPELNAFAKANKDVDVVAVTFDAVADTKNFVGTHKLHWPVVANASKYIDKIGVTAYPTLALVSPEGKLLALRSGGLITTGSRRTMDSKLEDWVRKSLQSKHK